MWKFVVLGIDGAAWNLIKPLIAQGKLPNFKHLVSNGVSGTLESIVPMYTPIIWTSIATGKNKSITFTHARFKKITLYRNHISAKRKRTLHV